MANPARAQATKRLAAAQAELANAERALAQLLGSQQPATTKNQALPAAPAALTAAQAAIAAATAERDAHPAKLPANQIHPDAKHARLHLRRRALQMVPRLLAYNGEHWLAQRLGAYLQDPNEYRALTRQLLHQPGHITYPPKRSPSPSTRPPPPGSPEPCACSSKRSTLVPLAYPAITAPSPTPSRDQH